MCLSHSAKKLRLQVWIQVHTQFLGKISLSAPWLCFWCRFIPFSDRLSFSEGGRGERWAGETGRRQSKEPSDDLLRGLDPVLRPGGTWCKTGSGLCPELICMFPPHHARIFLVCCVVSVHVRNWILSLEGTVTFRHLKYF